MAVLKYWDGTQYVPVMGSIPEPGAPGAPGPAGPATYAQVATAAPAPRGVGDLWVDSSAPLLQWDDDWIHPPLSNGWTNYGTGYTPARYRKIPGGMVVIDGLVGAGTLNSTVFVLPSGYRPSGTLLLPQVGSAADASVFGGIEIRSDGVVTQITVATVVDTGWLSLNAVFFAEV